MSQEIKYIQVADLVLWTENPRDPIDSNAKDQDIVDIAINDKSGLWKLSKLAAQMGDYYDFSEIPIVVYEEKKPVVFDGNRRVILAKIAKKLVTVNTSFKHLPSVPDEIPCNVCDKQTAIESILRKHGTTGSWRPLERDRFILKYIGGEKSDFIIIEEATGLISKHEKMNQGFVRDEVFSASNMNKLGLRINDGKLESRHNHEVLTEILEDLCAKVEGEFLSTRKSRGNVLAVLDDKNKQLVEEDKNNSFEVADAISYEIKNNNNSVIRRTRRTKDTSLRLFGKSLHLKTGDVNNLYRDICDLEDFYNIHKSHLSSSFTALIRMSLRLLCETASVGKMDDFVKKYFERAKKTLTKDEKTLMSTQNVTASSIVQLLQTGAHNYSSSQNYDQTLAISFILGAMIQISHNR